MDRYLSPCLRQIGPDEYRCQQRNITFRTAAAVVRCCADMAAIPAGAQHTPATLSRPEVPALCRECLHLDRNNRCRLFKGCDARQVMQAVASRSYCRHRITTTPQKQSLLGELSRDTFVTTARLCQDTLAFASHLDAGRFAWVAGVSRSGLLPASIIATHFHLPLACVYPGGDVKPLGTGFRMGREPRPLSGPGLVIDDTACSGESFTLIRDTLSREGLNAVCAAVYAAPAALSVVDVAGFLYPEPHFLEWNFANNVFTDRLAWDFDGILCPDPPGPDTDPTYPRYLQEAPPLITPRRSPIVIVSARHERTRPATEAWLRKHGIRWRKLILWEDNPDARWATPTTVAEWKARELEKLRPAGIRAYVESDPRQAQLIATLAKMPVICPAAGRVFNIDTDGTDGHWS